MTQYRYARTVGEFLPTKFVGDSTPKGTFKTLASYDLRVKFASGTNKHQNSFVSPNPITDYYASTKQLVAWWRLDKDVKASVGVIVSLKDSSGKGHTLYSTGSTSAGAGNSAPSFEAGDSPSVFVQTNSLAFATSNNAALRSIDTNSFSFVNGNHDTPFSISVWVKPISLPAFGGYLISKYESASQAEWSLDVTAFGKIRMSLYDSSGNSQSKTTTDVNLSVGNWTHIVSTYDGRSGNSAADGIKFYINGKVVDSPSATPSSYIKMVNSEARVSIGTGEAGAVTLPANIAEIAIWRKDLLPREVSTLYGVKNAGAYRLVRDYAQKSRVIDEVSGDAPVHDIALADENSSGSSGFYREGINITTLEDLTGYLRRKIRPNSGFITTLNGRDMPRNSFNDNFSPTGFPPGPQIKTRSIINNQGNVVTETYIANSGSIARSTAQFSVNGKISSRVSHEREQRDLGQPDPYLLDGSPYHETVTVTSGVFNPVALIKEHPFSRELPPYIVDQTGLGSMNGVIEAFPIRSIVDHSTTEIPFTARGVKCSINSMTDAFNRSLIIKTGYNLNETGCPPFLDTIEIMGSASLKSVNSGLAEGGVTIQGEFYQQPSTISPFVAVTCDMQKVFSGSVSSSISDVLVSGSLPRRVDNSAALGSGGVIKIPAQSNNSNKIFDIMGTRGFVFNNDSTHIDSIAYGGWKK